MAAKRSQSCGVANPLVDFNEETAVKLKLYETSGCRKEEEEFGIKALSITQDFELRTCIH